MLTCKVGENIINCFDGTYDKYQLKKWSDKNILICPDCGKPYEYCHGKIVPPYFRHKEKDINCDGIYSEPETKEHIDGKTILYYWLLGMQNQGIIKNLKLEAYIPETKQRPDIYFECEGVKYVIEFQCSPIATEYLERHELYQLANINDIWILGLDKYNIEQDEYDNIIHSKYYKTIEKYTDFYLNSNNKCLFVGSNLIVKHLPYKKIVLNDYYKFSIEDLYLNKVEKSLTLNVSSLNKFIELDIIKNDTILEQERLDNKLELEIKDIINTLNNRYKYFSYSFDCTKGNCSSPYLWSIEVCNKYDEYRFFIKSNFIDFCSEYETSVPFRGKRGGTGWRKQTGYSTIESMKYDSINTENITSFISIQTDKIIQKQKLESQKIKEENKKLRDKYYNIFGEFLDTEIYLINGGHEKVPETIRFKFLKGFNIGEQYMLNTFIKELKFLKSINANKYIFMIPKYHSYFNCLGFSRYVRVGDFDNKILEHFKNFGFTKVKYLNY